MLQLNMTRHCYGIFSYIKLFDKLNFANKISLGTFKNINVFCKHDAKMPISNCKLQHFRYLSNLRSSSNSKKHSLYFDALYRIYLSKQDTKSSRLLFPLNGLFSIVTELKAERDELLQIQTETSNDKEMLELAMKDILELDLKLEKLQAQILHSVLNVIETEEISDFTLEISPGVGGQEAMLFAKELLEMYYSFCISYHYTLDGKISDETELGGIRSGALFIKDKEAYRKLKYEGGIHRVQRIPKTEKAGRLHTSTASVLILPQPSEILISIDTKDLKLETMRATGAGGQHVNKTDSAVRLTHLPSGIAVECQTSRSQEANKKEALLKLRARLYQIQLDKQESHSSFQRKLQMGTRARSEKIRTYNYPQDRLTDHRLSLSLYNLNNILSGGSSLNKLFEELESFAEEETLTEYIERGLKSLEK